MPRLTTKYVESATRPGRHYDDAGTGLYLSVKERAGRLRKSYMQRVTIHGHRCEIGLGSIRWTTPSEARAAAQANWKIARTGGDPRRGKATVPTFADALDAVLAIQAPTWRNPKSEPQWRASLRDYAGALMAKPVDRIGPADVLAVVGPVWNAKRETARRVKQRIGVVMKWAIAEGHRTDNPVDAIAAALPKNGHGRKHFRAMPYAAVSGALATVRATGAWWATKAALEFLTLTAARSGEVRGMRWSEVEGDTWTVPAGRIKAGREHRVPLSPAAVAILETAREHADGSGLVFPSVRGKVMSDATMGKLLTENGIDSTVHGFRTSFRTWAAERTNIPREVAEAALAHVVENKVEAAYQRSDLFELRRDLMERWAAYLGELRGKVVALR